MAVKKAKKQEPESKSIIKNLDEAPAIYTNAIQITASLFDFRIRCSQALASDDSGVLLREVALIYMSPHHAKSLLRLLVSRIHLYERELGEIPGSPMLKVEEVPAGEVQ